MSGTEMTAHSLVTLSSLWRP